MIDLPVSRHIQRIVASTTLFFTTIFLIVYLPLNIIKSLIPTTLPYNVSWTADTPLSELSLELLVLQVPLVSVPLLIKYRSSFQPSWNRHKLVSCSGKPSNSGARLLAKLSTWMVSFCPKRTLLFLRLRSSPSQMLSKLEVVWQPSIRCACTAFQLYGFRHSS